MNIDYDELKKAPNILTKAFNFKNSPQGFEYWKEVCDNLFSLDGNRYDFVSTADKPFIPNTQECEKFCKCLLNAFVWMQSPQGEKYWEEVWGIVHEFATGDYNNSNQADPIKAYERAMRGI